MNTSLGLLVLTCWLPMVISMKLCLEQSFEDKNNVAGRLKNLININVPPKGTSFRKIKGPKQYEDVCIVGAGPAGIHMALNLDEKGYKKIRIFEKTHRVGGKSYDVQLEGHYRAQGAIFLSPDYHNNFIQLAKDYTNSS